MYVYDALNRMTIRATTPYTYNGDGALVNDGTTRYTQDLAAPLTQVLQTTQGSATTDNPVSRAILGVGVAMQSIATPNSQPLIPALKAH